MYAFGDSVSSVSNTNSHQTSHISYTSQNGDMPNSLGDHTREADEVVKDSAGGSTKSTEGHTASDERAQGPLGGDGHSLPSLSFVESHQKNQHTQRMGAGRESNDFVLRPIHFFGWPTFTNEPIHLLYTDSRFPELSVSKMSDPDHFLVCFPRRPEGVWATTPRSPRTVPTVQTQASTTSPIDLTSSTQLSPTPPVSCLMPDRDPSHPPVSLKPPASPSPPPAPPHDAAPLTVISPPSGTHTCPRKRQVKKPQAALSTPVDTKASGEYTELTDSMSDDVYEDLELL
eukprot:GHVN01098542.1.p2 GENE.GHVN01098542.1~~GHVN01098542.1.p2  ORF type:complete len:286 (+),score=75.75 GHVN01098542.1:1021-1878(+)